MTLFDEVAAVLSEHGVAHALIGAFALAAHGVSRSTADQDLLVTADLILMKLYAGGSQDRWDIEQLLVVKGDAATIAAVDDRIAVLPARSREMWLTLRPNA